MYIYMAGVCCNVLQRVAECCYVLQCVAVYARNHSDTRRYMYENSCVVSAAVCCSVLQCVAVCCSVLQRVAV